MVGRGLIAIALASVLICELLTPQGARAADIISATIAVPDHPNPLSYNPTSLKDIKAADPSSRIGLIEPPQAGADGAATLSYVLDVPSGRGGMQPNLVVRYSSQSGNGWLGLGWDLGTQAVVIDTRWGVPVYDRETETETYLLGGVQLSPLAHRGTPQPRSAEKTFESRVEGTFERVIRHGAAPNEYWWEVVDKFGKRFFYGGSPAGGVATDSVLADDSGNTFRWDLREVRDPNGNGIRYTYARRDDPGVLNGNVPGRQLYPKTINYTQSDGSLGPYTVTFIRDTEQQDWVRRPDVIIDGRGGFKAVTADLLKRVEVALSGQPVRAYEFHYEEGAFRKTLLKSVTQLGADGSRFYEHSFTYFDDVRGDAGYHGFGTSSVWSTGRDNVTAGLLGQGQATALSGALSDSVGGHIYVGFNPDLPTKEGSAGAKVGYVHSSTEGVLSFVDLNGDGLPDKVFRAAGGFAFRANRSGPSGPTVFGPTQLVPTLPTLFRESSNTTSFGAEAYFGANAIANEADTFTTGSAYFSDVNGDGLNDLVNDGVVYFNHLDASGIPTFTVDSTATPVPIGPGAVDSTDLIDDYESIYQQSIDRYPLVDTFRRWVAPFSGHVEITGDVALAAGVHPADADGVRVAIQRNGLELWARSTGASETTAMTPTDVDDVVVAAGDRLYFRVQSIFQGTGDRVNWAPRIRYRDVTELLDVNLLDVYRYDAFEDFTLAGRLGISVQVPVDGIVRLSGDVHKIGLTTDDIVLLVLKNHDPVLSRTLAWNETGTIALTEDLSVAEGDKLELRLRVDSPIDLNQLRWVPDLFYVSSPTLPRIIDDNGNYLVQLHPPFDIDMYPATNLSAPQAPWTATRTGTLSVFPQIRTAPEDRTTTGILTFTVKSPGERRAKQEINVVGGRVEGTRLEIDVRQGESLYFDYSSHDPELTDRFIDKRVLVAYGDASTAPRVAVPSAFHSATFPGLYAEPYRGWTSGGYNGNRERSSQPIDEGLLVLAHDYDPAAAKAYPFNPFPENAMWRGPDDLTWVAPNGMSASRLGPDSIAVPRPGSFAGSRAVTRISHTSQVAVGGGVSLLSGSISTGRSYGEVDYMDMNGDRFPDVLGRGRIQYTTPAGGLESASRPIPGFSLVRDSGADQDRAINVGVGGSPATFKGNSRGDVDGRGAPRENNTGTQMVSLGLSGSLGEGSSTISQDLVDVNGDGLPDIVVSDGTNLTVAFNLGHHFSSPPEPWGPAAITSGSSASASIGATLGFNGGIYDYAGGLSLSKNDSQVNRTLVDLNGDALPDAVRVSGGQLRVGFNTGNGFADEVLWQGNVGSPPVGNRNTGLGAGAYFTIGIGPLCWPTPLCYIIINPGADASENMARQEAALLDVDGDGYADQVTSTSDDVMTVAPNRTGRTNLLRTVERPLGATIDLGYERDGNTAEQPQSRWVLSRVIVRDGHAGDGVDEQITTYRYEGGVYSRLERQFFGYRRVVEEQRDTGSAAAVYRSVVREYRNDGYYTSGLSARETTLDGAGRPFVETENSYELINITNPGSPSDPNGTMDVLFPELTRTDSRFYEGAPSPVKSIYSTFGYDAVGNEVRFFNSGDPGTDDDVSAMIEYSSCSESHIIGSPTKIVVTAGNAAIRHRESTVDCATGNVTQVREFLDQGTARVTDLNYYGDGNLQQVTGPPNVSDEHYQVSYEYDALTRTHVTKIGDRFGYVSSATHDLRYGEIASTTDTNGNTTSYSYDSFGRLVNVVGPYEQSSGIPTLRIEYHPEGAVPWALTRHLDKFRDPQDPIDTVLFIDGLKRVVETKKDATVHTGPGTAARDGMIVSGRLTFDAFGRTTQVFYPTFEPLGSAGTFNPAYDAIQPTRTVYDVLDRTSKVTVPDGTSTTMNYGFAADRSGQVQFATSMRDANGIEKRTYRNARQLIVSVQESLTVSASAKQLIWTSYGYDALGQLIEVRDDHDNITRTSYDALGRQTSMVNPDRGKEESVYDLASNVIARVTANLRSTGSRITYAYEFNRLKGITYPNFRENNVRYEYGPPGIGGNAAGRITRVTDESGSEVRSYGKLGEMTRQVKTVASDTQGSSANSPETYATDYVYDTFGRLQRLTFPDGEILTNRYDSGGLLRETTGDKAGLHYDYIRRLEYDQFEERVFLETGDEVRTVYRYQPENRRLATLQAGKGNGALFQNLSYSYDNVGNVRSIANDIQVPPASQLGGPSTQTFDYDSLYRLTTASGTYRTKPDRNHNYNLSLGYDTLHNITSKTQTADVVQPSGGTVPTHDATYASTYAYTGLQPHAPTHIGERTFAYDADGNQLGWTNDKDGTRRTIVWDEEDRIQTISDNGREQSYKYNDQGERVVKRGAQGETIYVNPFFTIRDREVGTKHVYAGTTRVVSKLVKQDKPGANPRGGTPRERDLFFYHGDHVGSTSYVTDANGSLFEHLEYFPFGETWIDEASTTQRTPYRFTGKELDEETGLYYFGSRYYDPKTSVWQSPDRVPNSVVASQAGLAELPRKLSVYAYSRLNPIRLADPDGNDYRDYIPGTTAGENAAQYYADLVVAGEAQGGFAGAAKQVAGWSGGLFASLWTRETAGETAATLATAGIGSAARLGAAGVKLAQAYGLYQSLKTGIAIGEAATGTSITGEELTGRERVIRGVSGALGALLLGKEALAQKAFTPYWRYTGAGSNPNSQWLTRGAEPPYGTNYRQAEDALQIPSQSRPITNVRQADVPWWEPVIGPRPAAGNPSFGGGGGPEWFRGFRDANGNFSWQGHFDFP